LYHPSVPIGGYDDDSAIPGRSAEAGKVLLFENKRAFLRQCHVLETGSILIWLFCPVTAASAHCGDIGYSSAMSEEEREGERKKKSVILPPRTWAKGYFL
jgi:hypothetical protein